MNSSDDSHRRYMLIISGIILFSSAIIIALNYYSIKTLSSIRSYINLESEYSKAQKDATRYLIDYIQTSDLQSYTEFRKEIAVPTGDSIARVALQKNQSYETIRIGFLRGRNHPEDIDNMIWMFNNFRNVPYFRDAIIEWTKADGDVANLDRIGKFIFRLGSEPLNSSTQFALKNNVDTINRRLTNNQQAFSSILGEASRGISYWLLFINVFFILLILASAGFYARHIFRQLVESKRLIIEQNDAKDEFISIASHELKTPLTSMKASLQILERFAKNSADNKKLHPFIINSIKNVNRLTDLVKDLLDVTSLQNGKLTLNKKQFYLNELIHEVVAEKQGLSHHKYIINELVIEEVEADPNRIYQVFENFLSNAVKYSPESDEIHICSYSKNGSVKVCVKDFGRGIDKDKIPYLFDRFFRLEETRNSVQGLGLGLYICKEIINTHKGEIGAESELGQGSVFWFTLPL